MSTFNEMVYMIMDQNKMSSDDSFLEQSHIFFILTKIRAYFLKEKYSKLKSQISSSNFQSITLHLEPVRSIPGCATNSTFMKSKEKVPNLLLLNNYEGLITVSTVFGVPASIVYVNNNRFLNAGHERWQHNIIYATVGPDSYLYLKSNNEDISYMEKITLSAVFEDVMEANELVSKNGCDEDNCDPMENQFPLEEGLTIPVITMVSQQLYQDNIKPADTINNASDDMSNIQNYVSRITKEKYK